MSTHAIAPSRSNAAGSAALNLPRRPRRLRRSAAIRSLVRETRLSADMFIYPLFVVPGEGQRREVGSMPGVFQLSVDEIVREAAAAKAEGIPGVLLFGLPEDKDDVGSAAYDPEAPVQNAVRALKREVPGLLVVLAGVRAAGPQETRRSDGPVWAAQIPAAVAACRADPTLVEVDVRTAPWSAQVPCTMLVGLP